MAELFIGLMSGTSADGVDAALVDFTPSLRVVHAKTYPLPAQLRAQALAISLATPLGEIAALDVRLGEFFAQAAQALLEEAGVPAANIRGIGSHGQTIWHQPSGETPFTLQIGDPNILVERTGITVVADFRRRDVAAGGQGAPLVPAFHAEVLSSDRFNRCVLNLGGIANITILPKEATRPVSGFDTGPANTLLDAWIFRHQRRNFDQDGAWAARGKCHAALLDALLGDEYFRQLPPKSTGREHFSLGWLDRHLGKFGDLKPEDVQATLVALTATTVAQAIGQHAPETEQVLVCGGGAANPMLLQALASQLHPISLISTATLGVDPDYVEACAFAWLARRTLLGLPGNLPAVTGARRATVLGGVYPAGG
jgi:anhydro-N-acetylmuramic acid kinase